MSCESPSQPEQVLTSVDPLAARAIAATRLLVDTHVHLYPRYDIVGFFDKAKRNFDRADAKAKGGSTPVGCLMLTETAKDDAFAMLLRRNADPGDTWAFHACGDGVSLWATNGSTRLLVIAGCQVITHERLEVLVLGTRERVADGMEINQTIAAALETGGQVVLPYGLGKWTGKRAEIATQAFYKWHKRGLRLGDNAGRPRGLPDNGLLHCARKVSTPIFPGSDPLDISSGERRAGCYGLVLQTSLLEDSPASGVLGGLAELPVATQTFGKRVGMTGCLIQQILLRWHKRKNKHNRS